MMQLMLMINVGGHLDGLEHNVSKNTVIYNDNYYKLTTDLCPVYSDGLPSDQSRSPPTDPVC